MAARILFKGRPCNYSMLTVLRLENLFRGFSFIIILFLLVALTKFVNSCGFGLFVCVFFSGLPALAVDIRCHPANFESHDKVLNPSDGKSIVESIFDGIFLAAVPKHRRSRERRAMRRLGVHNVVKYMTPKRNIVACLECGSWHEAHTVCG